MTKLVMLNPRTHKNLRINPKLTDAHGANERLVPVVLSEFPRLALHYPVVFTKNNETGQFVCVAIFGFEKGENLFWKENTWDAAYKPLNVARQPFFIGREKEDDNDGDDNYVICIDSESRSLQADEGELLFDASGKETKYLENMKSVLASLLEGERKTNAFLDKLLALDLLTPLSLDITFANNESQRVEGTYTIDENKLQTLSGDAIAELHSLGYLAPLYSMIISLGQFYPLITRKNALLAKGSQWFKAAGNKTTR